MTPLAQRILNDSTLPEPDRCYMANGLHVDVPRELLGAICFELSAVMDAVPTLGLKMMDVRDGVIQGMKEERFAFLPAPSTWIEYTTTIDGERQRVGLLLMSAGDLVLVTICVGDAYRLEGVAECALPLKGSDKFGQFRSPNLKATWAKAEVTTYMMMDIYPMLAIINTPRVIGRRQHMPHAGLQRKLARSRGMVGKFPLQPWTEIVLQVKPPDMDEGERYARLTGGKALHFCRAHLRIRNGKLELVSAHWRGDAALGIKRSRYTVLH